MENRHFLGIMQFLDGDIFSSMIVTLYRQQEYFEFDFVY